MSSPRQNINEVKINSHFAGYANSFSKYFLNKAVVALVLNLMDQLKEQGMTEEEVKRIQDYVYLILVALQGSMATSGSAFFCTKILNKLGCNESNSEWAGFIFGTVIGLAMDSSPLDIVNTAATMMGGMAGKWCVKRFFQPANPQKMAEQKILELESPTLQL